MSLEHLVIPDPDREETTGDILGRTRQRSQLEQARAAEDGQLECKTLE